MPNPLRLPHPVARERGKTHHDENSALPSTRSETASARPLMYRRATHSQHHSVPILDVRADFWRPCSARGLILGCLCRRTHRTMPCTPMQRHTPAGILILCRTQVSRSPTSTRNVQFLDSTDAVHQSNRGVVGRTARGARCLDRVSTTEASIAGRNTVAGSHGFPTTALADKPLDHRAAVPECDERLIQSRRLT